MYRRDFLKLSLGALAGTMIGDQALELLERLGPRKLYFPGHTFPKMYSVKSGSVIREGDLVGISLRNGIWVADALAPDIRHSALVEVVGLDKRDPSKVLIKFRKDNV